MRPSTPDALARLRGQVCALGAKLPEGGLGDTVVVRESAESERPTSRRPTAVGTGLIALDVIVDAAQNGHPTLAAGGTCGNVLTALSFLGWGSYPIARLNGDAASQLLQEDLARWNVRLDFAREVPSSATPIILQTIRRHAGGAPTHSFSLVCPSCRRWFPRFLPVRRESANSVLDRFREHRSAKFPQVFFFDRVSRSALMLAEHFAAQGAAVMFEPSGRAKLGLFEEALEVAHIVKYSHQRMPELAKQNVKSEARLLEIETLGSDGLKYRSPHTGWTWQKRRALVGPPLVDSAGAGDWCTAGLLSALAVRGLEGLLATTEDELERALGGLKLQRRSLVPSLGLGARCTLLVALNSGSRSRS